MAHADEERFMEDMVNEVLRRLRDQQAGGGLIENSVREIVREELAEVSQQIEEAARSAVKFQSLFRD